MYCLKRDPKHKDHQKEEISIEVDSLRKSLSYALSNHQNSFKSFLMTTKESIVAARTRFATAVKERKGKCLKEYCELLNREEKLLLDKFEDAAKANLEQYATIPMIEFCQKQLRKHDVEISLLRNEILEKMKTHGSSACLKKNDLQLSDDYKFNSEHPLGCVDVCNAEEIVLLINSPSWSTFTCMATPQAINGDTDVTEKIDNVSSGVGAVSLKEDAVVDVKDLKSQGNEFFKKSMLKEAVECYSKAIEHCPVNNSRELAVLFQNRAAAYEKLNLWEAVVADCSKAIQLDDRYIKAISRRARAYQKLGKKEQWVHDAGCAWILEQASNPQRCFCDANKPFGDAIADLADERAENMLKERGPELPPNDFIRKMIGNNDGFSILNISSTSGNKNDIRFRKIMSNMKKNKYEAVLKMCSQEINDNGKHKIRASLLQGILRYLKLDEEGAAWDFNVVKDWFETSRPQDRDSIHLVVEALCRLAEIKFFRFDDNEGSFEAIEFAIKIDPNYWKPYATKANFLRCIEQHDEALSELKKAASFNSSFAPLMQLARFFIELGNIDEAEGTYKNATTRFPQCAWAWSSFGCFLKEQGREEEALQMFDRALSLDTSMCLEAYMEKAAIMIGRGDIAAASALYHSAIAADKTYYLAYQGLGILLRDNLCQFESAIKWFNKTIPLIRQNESDLARAIGHLLKTEVQYTVLRQYGYLQENETSESDGGLLTGSTQTFL